MFYGNSENQNYQALVALLLQSSTVAKVRSRTGLLLFGTFELAIFMPFKVGKFCIPQKEALLPIV